MCISVLIVICYLTIREKHMQHFRKVHVHIISVFPGKNRFLPVLFLGKGKKGRKSFVYLLSNSLKTTYIIPAVLLTSDAFPGSFSVPSTNPLKGYLPIYVSLEIRYIGVFSLFAPSQRWNLLYAVFAEKWKLKLFEANIRNKFILVLWKLGLIISRCGVLFSLLLSTLLVDEYVVSLLFAGGFIMAWWGDPYLWKFTIPFSLPLRPRVWVSLQVLNFPN